MDLRDIPRLDDGAIMPGEWIVEHRHGLTEGPFVDGVSCPVPGSRLRHLVVAFGPDIVRAWSASDPSFVVGEPREGVQAPPSAPERDPGPIAPREARKPARERKAPAPRLLVVPDPDETPAEPSGALDHLDRAGLKAWARERGLDAFVDFRLGEAKLREALLALSSEAGR